MRRPISFFTFAVILIIAAIAAFHTALIPRSRQGQMPVAAGQKSVARSDGAYFSDHDRVGERVVAAINQSRKTIDAAMYSLTEPAIAAALEAAARRGVRVRIVADEGQSQERHSEIPYLETARITVRLSGGYRGQRSLMHDKFAVFDGRLVETGSFNWTTSADDYNYENAVFIADPSIASQFEDEFERIWSRAR